MTITTSTGVGVSQRTNLYAAKQMLEHAMPVMVLEKVAVTKPMPRNNSRTAKFRRPKTFTAQTTPLVEGVTPNATSFQYEDVEVTINQYGQVVVVTDVIEDTHEDPVLQDATQMCGENIGRTQEALDWAVVRGGTNVFYSNGTTRAAVNTPISLAKQDAIIRALKAQKAMKIRESLSGSPNYATHPIWGAYIGVAHTDLEHDIQNLPGFVPVANYGSRQPMCDEEIGSVKDVRYVLSPDLASFADAGGAKGSMKSTTGTSADVYPVMYFGKAAFGKVALRGRTAIEPSIIPVGQKTKDDPLAQRGYVGWKMWHGSLILNDLWMVRLEAAVTDL